MAEEQKDEPRKASEPPTPKQSPKQYQNRIKELIRDRDDIKNIRTEIPVDKREL